MPIVVPSPQAALQRGASVTGGIGAIRHRLPLLMIILVVALVPAVLAALRGKGEHRR